MLLGGRIIVMMPLLMLLDCRNRNVVMAGVVIGGSELLVLLPDVKRKLSFSKLCCVHLGAVLCKPRELCFIGSVVIILPFMIVLWIGKRKY